MRTLRITDMSTYPARPFALVESIRNRSIASSLSLSFLALGTLAILGQTHFNPWLGFCAATQFALTGLSANRFRRATRLPLDKPSPMLGTLSVVCSIAAAGIAGYSAYSLVMR